MDIDLPKIYFCGSIRGGRSDQELYSQLITYLNRFGKVLTEHVGDKEVLADHNLSSSEIYTRDLDWLKQADFIVAEVSTPSLGVGFEIATAVKLNKKILCLSRTSKKDSLSAMISGCPDLKVVEYSNISEAELSLKLFINTK